MAGRAEWPLFLHGGPGTGKTFAALVLLDYAGGKYWELADLCDTLNRARDGRLTWSREGYGGTHWPEDVWAWVAKAPLVVLDELGVRKDVSDFAYETIKRVLDRRERKPLVCISNLAGPALQKLYDVRIVSRLTAGTVLELQGEDRRLSR